MQNRYNLDTQRTQEARSEITYLPGRSDLPKPTASSHSHYATSHSPSNSLPGQTGPCNPEETLATCTARGGTGQVPAKTRGDSWSNQPADHVPQAVYLAMPCAKTAISRSCVVIHGIDGGRMGRVLGRCEAGGAMAIDMLDGGRHGRKTGPFVDRQLP